MIERGSGRTSGLTDWQLMDVLSMWACLQDHDTRGHWKQVQGWQKVCDLAQTHLDRLRQYRRGLAEAWPPQTNSAAQAYVGELDELIDRVQRTHDAAAANYDALSAATRAIDSARPELKRVYEEYATKLQQKQGYEATAADPKAVAGSRVVTPPVTEAELEQLNVRARGIMFGLSGELQQAQVMLRQPPPKPTTSRQPDQQESPGGPTPSPAIPPIVPVPIASPTPSSGSNEPSRRVKPVPTPTAPAVGPVLGGAGAALAPAAANPGITGVTPPLHPNPPGTGISLPPPLPSTSGSTNSGGSARLPGSPNQLGRLGGGTSGSSHVTQPPRPMPPGGLIGGVPGMGLGQPGSGANSPRRVNPVGGLIGGGSAGTAPTGAAGSRPGTGRAGHFGPVHGMPPIGGAPGIGPSGRPGRRELEDGETRRWDPDHPWETEEGVNPVVRPPDDDGPIDPGPAIGFNR